MLTPDQYVETILAKYAVPRGPMSPAEKLGSMLEGPLRKWAGQQLNALQYSGSYAKGTAVRGTSDVDVFISLKSDTTSTLKEIYEKLVSLAQGNGWSPRRQNVSVGVTVNGTQGDLVPGKAHESSQYYHSLYLRKRDSWTQTNVTLHIDTVRKSERLIEIRALKIWRMLHRFDFPSIYLELFTINALSGRSRTTLADNVLHVLRTIDSSLVSTRIVDPANSSNILSDDLTQAEKKQVAAQAANSVREHSWGKIIW
jgi:hypothetical protein